MKKVIICIPFFIGVLFLTPIVQSAATIPLGVNYTHHAITQCNLQGGNGIISSYHRSGVRAKVKNQLATMVNNGKISVLRVLVWNMRDVENQDWGVISSAGGKMQVQDRQNWINFLTDMKETGIATLYLSFGHMGANSFKSDSYNNSYRDENWGFFKEVRALAYQYGPAQIYVDLHNEIGNAMMDSEAEKAKAFSATGIPATCLNLGLAT